ncbi:hypothetical protein D1610_14465 [Sphingomonas gilva]|uniref:Uncharacterized protein n=1 Tax=Sphingomonas gilva TaxID=2305907 RepID=A0A396RLV9_9SPHN|nr:hypothetical protein [Sphingomonas gilva]RHW16596.1 hypothetical protein D1610_14465 [Sphingomonas gilva]
MNAVTPIAPKQSKGDSCEAAHLFRSKLIDLFAVVEVWANDTLERANSKPQHLLGQKLDTIRKLAISETGNLPNAKTVLPLLDSILPFAELRSALCHSQIKRMSGTWVCFRPSAAPGVLRWRPVLLDNPSMEQILRDLAELVRALRDTRP